jgi:protein required for attachment to host cells
MSKIKMRSHMIMAIAMASGATITPSLDASAKMQAMNDHYRDMKNGMRSMMSSGNGKSRKRKSNMNHVSRMAKRANRRKLQNKTR